MPPSKHDRKFSNASSWSQHTRNASRSDYTPVSPPRNPQAPSFPTITSTSTNAERRSGSFEYDAPGTTPYWDDTYGVIYETPEIPPRHPGRTYAQALRRGLSLHDVSEGHVESDQDTPQREFLQHTASQNSYPQSIGKQLSRKGNFTPWSDATDDRHAASSNGSIAGNQISSSRPALSSKDVNQKLSHELKEKTKAKASTRASLKNSIKLPPAWKELRPSPASVLKQEAIFGIPKTAAKEARPMSALVEEPDPLRIVKKKSTSRAVNRIPSNSSPMLERVRQLRDLEQKAILAKLEGDLMNVKATESTAEDDDIDVFPDAEEANFDVFTGGQTKQQSMAHKEARHSQHTEEFIPNIELSDSDWAKPLYALANPPAVPPKSPKRNLNLNAQRNSMVATIHSVDDSDESNAQSDDSLVDTMSGMRFVPNLPPTPPKHRPFQRKSAVPEGLDLKQIQAAKEKLKEKPVITVAQDAVPNVVGVGVVNSKRNVQLVKASRESVATTTSSISDDFEQLGSPGKDDTEHNGASRKWYKGFRR
ncbi:hypothetical protein N0V83_005441 [Neocucurbitaria cava]|uniref:Uncharacterized protein n=1 Tax=Neocucurbitaria cava TaxID=798079 RepID=A0A9W8Y7A2_9PLEO|nr:hypothetical protein N0V83_005441 [Neocucurbitaria cava]